MTYNKIVNLINNKIGELPDFGTEIVKHIYYWHSDDRQYADKIDKFREVVIEMAHSYDRIIDDLKWRITMLEERCQK